MKTHSNSSRKAIPARLAAMAAFLLLTSNALATVFVWNNAYTNGYWGEPNNWNNASGFPNDLTNDFVFLPAEGVTNMIIADSNGVPASFVITNMQVDCTNELVANLITIPTNQFLRTTFLQLGPTNLSVLGTTTLKIVGDGEFQVAVPFQRANVGIQIGRSLSGLGNIATLDMSGLSSCLITNIGQLTIGDRRGAQPGTVLLASNTIISSGEIDLGFDPNVQETLLLGTGTNIIGGTLRMAVGAPSGYGRILFQGTNGSVAFRPRSGSRTSAAADFEISKANTTSSANVTNLIDLRGHYADVYVRNIFMNAVNTIGSSRGRTGVSDNRLYFDQGVFDCTTSMQLGTAGQNPANVNLVSIGGGKVNFAGVLSLAFLNPIALSGIGPGTLMIGGGTVTLTNGGIAKYTLGALNSTTNVATLILNSTNNADPAVLDLNGHAIGTATEPIDNAQFMAGTLKNLSEFNGGSNVVKTGAGLLTLSGANTYTGGTVVGGGTLFFDADMALSPNTPLFDVGAGAVLDVSALTGGTLALGAIIPQILIGGGTILGNVNVMANSTVSPGHSTGTLTVTNAITLGGTTIMELNRANVPNSDRIVAASITYGGALSVTNDGSTLHAGDSFLLFSGPTSGSFATVNLPSTDYTGATYTWTNKLAVDGTIAVLTAVGGTSTTPTNITFVLNGGALTLSWPADHTGWYLQAQTNSLAIGLSSNWFTVPGSQTTNQVNTMIDPTKGCVFYRLFLP